jgi:regulator of protease activity HflC (stomatin/prohibitin superfamily)
MARSSNSGVSLTRRIPPDAVYNLLYNTGAVGNVDIDRNIFAIVADRTLTIFGREDILNIASERERIIGLMKTSIASELHRLFGIELIDLQITGFRFSPEYERAVNENSLAKTNAFRAEQILKQKEVEARQQVAEATGRADSAIQSAHGESESTLLKAQAEGKATEIQAGADAAAIKLRVDAAGGIDGYSKVMAGGDHETLERAAAPDRLGRHRITSAVLPTSLTRPAGPKKHFFGPTTEVASKSLQRDPPSLVSPEYQESTSHQSEKLQE